jgi:Hydroxymethylglutaryl-coenzyme A synthase N terminal
LITDIGIRYLTISFNVKLILIILMRARNVGIICMEIYFPKTYVDQNELGT